MMTRFISVFAAFVVFVTTYALVLPAITMEREADCGIEAHQHDDSCFEQQLICDLAESPGHQHDDSCYRAESVLKCVTAAHTHSKDCYGEEENLICEEPEHVHDETCYEEVRELVCELEESAGHQHDASCYENVLVCGKEVHVHSEECYHQDPVEEEMEYSEENDIPEEERYLEEYAVPEEEQVQSGDVPADRQDEDTAQVPADADPYDPGGSSGTGEDAAAAQQDGGGASVRTGDDAVQEAGAEVYIPETEVPLAAPLVPELESLDFRALLNSRTGIYYYHVQPDEVVENSAEITDWKKVTADTELGENDLLRVYLAYTLPAGAVNTTNEIVRYRLPGNLHLTDDQVKAINGTENGIAAQYVDYSTLTVTDLDNYHKYLGAEAVEGTRTPDQDQEAYLAAGGANGNGEEYISAVVRVENIYDSHSGALSGQDLVFTFVPYTVFKNRHEYGSDGQQTKTGLKVRGWFSLDFNMSQVDFEEPSMDGNREILFAGVVFAGEDRAAQIEEIRTDLHLVRPAETGIGAEADPEAGEAAEAEDPEAVADSMQEAENAEDAENAENSENTEAAHDGSEAEEGTEEATKDPENEEGKKEEDEEKLIKLFDEDPAEGDQKDSEEDSSKDANADSEKDAEKDSEKDSEKDAPAVIMPAMSFEDSIRVSTGRPAGAETKGAGGTVADAADALPKKAKVTVRVEADEGTFPAGTTMVLAAVKDLETIAETVQDTVENGSAAGTDSGTTDSTGNKAAGTGNPRTYGFQAVDISFHDADGNEIEPAKPVRVAMTSEIVDQVRQEQQEDPCTAVADPMVVHIDDNGNVETMDLIAPEEIEPAQGRTEEELREEAEAEAAARRAEEEKEAGAAKGTEEETGKGSEEETEQAGSPASADGGKLNAEETAGPAENDIEKDGSAGPAEDEEKAGSAGETDPGEEKTGQEREDTEEQAEHAADEADPQDVEKPRTVSFETDSFSVYVIVYTVDFHYEVNGKMYEFSIPGGGFASFYKIVEVLGISNQGTQSGSGDENEAENSEIEAGNGDNSDGDAVHNVVEETGVDDNGANGSNYEESIRLNNVEVSEATRKFVADVASVEFSNPELVWVGKVDEESTVGILKEANGLEVQYSAELTEEQIDEINSSTVEAGDWALIGVQPFTSEESLTVTMKNGDQFVVRVTDGQEATEVADIDTDGFYVIYVDRYYNNTHHYYALRNDGASVAVPNNNLDALGNEFTWRFGYDETACWWYNGSSFIEPEWSIVVGDNPGGRYLWIEKRGSGFGIHGNYWSDNYLSWDSSNGFKIVNNGFDVAIKIYEKDKPQLNFSVAVNNPSYGSVSCSNTVTDLEWKNTVPIVATPAEGCYFVGWRRGDEVLTGYDSTIPVGGIEFTQDNQILTAVFAKNYTSPATQEINEWVDSLLGNPLVSDKTAHVVDYDNRIYEVDLTASSSRYTIDQDIRIEFITDISRSMYFPESLLNEQDFTVNGQINLGQWLLNNGDPEKVYYVIGDVNNTATMYAVYFSGNNYFTRWSIVDASYYLPYDNASTSGRIKTVCEISNGRTTISITDRFADNRIFNGKIYNSTTKPPKDTADWDRLSYLTAAVNAVSRAIYRLDPGAQLGLVTFASAASGGTLYGADDEESFINALQSIQPTGGTNQRAAFNLINNSNPPVFTTNSGKRQVALLITDGAPQGVASTWDESWRLIEEAAGITEGKDVEIWTLGLALERVGNNKQKLMDLASDGCYSGNAEDADQLVAETKKILEEMLVKATVIGEVYDTVDPAFYPIDSSGNPIEEGYYYADTTGGSVTRHLSAPSDVKKAYYHWINDNGTWSIAYYNQEIKWPEDGGWKESFYIKAKEDFMGGNTISTNSGVDNRVEANRVKHSGSPDGYYWLNQDHSSFRVDYETPHVNVDELSMTENSTEWTVYLGTEVDPEKELRELWDKIRVNLVVKKNGMNADTNTVTNGSQMYYSDDLLNDAGSPDGTTNASLPLSHFVNPDLIETLLRQIKNGETTANSDLIYRYFPYGHSIIGTFELSLEKTVNQAAAEDGAPKQHETKEKGQEKEVYTLKVTYTPVGDNASTDYAHTTSGKSAGKVADGYDGTTGNRIDSENVHKIHVFVKNLEIQKKDMTNTNKLIDTAKFKLYRTAKKVIDPETGQETNQYETGTVDLKVGNETKKVVQIGDEMTTSGGKITVEDLSYAPDGVYYLEETKAPDGYIMAAEPIEMHLYLDDAYTHYLAPHGSITEAQTVNNPYNWTQSVNRLVYDNSKTAVVDDSKITIEVLNNPGVELPSTGGPGTTLIYLFGFMLTGIAGAGLVMKRKREAA